MSPRFYRKVYVWVGVVKMNSDKTIDMYYFDDHKINLFLLNPAAVPLLLSMPKTKEEHFLNLQSII